MIMREARRTGRQTAPDQLRQEKNDVYNEKIGLFSSELQIAGGSQFASSRLDFVCSCLALA
jgi:hypothetical protein